MSGFGMDFILDQIRHDIERLSTADSCRVEISQRIEGYLEALWHAGVLSLPEKHSYNDLALKAFFQSCGVPYDEPKPQLEQQEVLFDEPVFEVPEQTPSAGLRLLCLLDTSRTGEAPIYRPVRALRPMPPRVGPQGQWSLAGNARIRLRETHARPATAAVLARCLGHRQADALSAHSRAV